MLFSSLLSDVKARCAISDSTLDDTIKLWLNLGQQNITTRFLWPFLEKEGTITTVAATENYSLPSDLGYLYLVRNTTSSQFVVFRTLDEFYQGVPYPTATGSPTIFRLPGATQASTTASVVQQIAFYPIPDAAYTLKVLYYQQLADLSGVNDISFIPSQFHELLVHYACSAYFSREGDSRSVTHRDAYESGLLDMVSQLAGQPVSRVDVLQSSEDGTSPFGFVRFPPSFGPMS